MTNNVWVFTETFDDADPETTIYGSAEAAWSDLARRARDGGLPEEFFGPTDTDSSLAQKMLDFWWESMSLIEKEVHK